ncbi:hypothetical protein MLD38_006435 [Melastoma candidum]|uniref:Uncharacterized protein n=1 Tax=Melastoma candidum TaxID=119954 RepID=A0ACB9RMW8_9MYRT|nr:hypothetical protein MLD38_006435 [Melastoma candidum]
MTELTLKRTEPFFNLEPPGLRTRLELQITAKVERSLLFSRPLFLSALFSPTATSSVRLLFLGFVRYLESSLFCCWQLNTIDG